jgi:hypothetical protein
LHDACEYLVIAEIVVGEQEEGVEKRGRRWEFPAKLQEVIKMNMKESFASYKPLFKHKASFAPPLINN